MTKQRKSHQYADRRGAITVLAAFTITVVAMMAAFAVDTGHILYTRAKMVSAAENGAMAAAQNLPSEAFAIEEAKKVAKLNYDNVTQIVQTDDVEFGTWNWQTREFVPSTAAEANAVRVTASRTQDSGNPLPLFLGQFLGQKWANVGATAIASKQVFAGSEQTTPAAPAVYVTSTKDLSNVVLEFEDGSHQKYEGLSGKSGTFEGSGQHEGKSIVGVWIKSGSNESGDGPGYGEYIANPFDGATVEGTNVAKGPVPKVSATFESGSTVLRVAL